MKKWMSVFLAASGAVTIVFFQNCSKVSFKEMAAANGAAGVVSTASTETPTQPTLGVCADVSCDLDPLTKKPAVTTILMALGEEADSQLVVSSASSQLIAETVVRYSSPKANPKILVVEDSNTQGENLEDTSYVIHELLGRYDTHSMKLSSMGLTDKDVSGYDLIWFNNPGHPMGSSVTRDTLLRFAGGIVLQGDDLTQGAGFSLESLTGLHYVDQGTSVVCKGKSYAHDNERGEQYRVSLDAKKFTGNDNSVINFRYGNDIDNTTIVRADLEVLATAVGGPTDCTATRPAIVRYLK